ncbi:MAG TPA: Ldh family oxidoreductase [Xanthobacteraceae bacterium]|jgi:LDH2 family malate/lactate/ureidoglycolate dehydrogenase
MNERAEAAGEVVVEAQRLIAATAAIFAALGIDPEDAHTAAADLVAADLEGIASHGVMLVPMYVDRLIKGSVSRRRLGKVVSDNAGTIVIDAAHALGQLTARQAVKLAVARALEIGLAAVAVRNAFHFGTAGRYARLMAAQGCVGMVMSSTRPLLPAPGGAEALVGNNPIAIALPSAGDFPVEVDMALSATAMGRIRLAAAAGRPIPSDWAVDGEGRPTTDPAAAIKGMLLPAAGAKGFGLAFVIDLLCGGLSEGAVGAEVTPLYGDPAEPYRCAHFFLAIDVGHFANAAGFAQRVRDQAIRASRSKRGPGVERIYAPGELVWATRRASADTCRLDAQTLRSLGEAAARAGIGNFADILRERKGTTS